MPKSYRHIKEYELELNELRKQGLTEKEIGKKLGFSYKQVHNFFSILKTECIYRTKLRPMRRLASS